MSYPILAIFGLQPGEVILILVAIFLLFGATKIPQIMKGMGQGIGEFKKGLRESQNEEKGKELPKTDQVASTPPNNGAGRTN